MTNLIPEEETILDGWEFEGDVDTVTGEPLPAQLVRAAKQEEIEWLHKNGVYHKVPLDQCARADEFTWAQLAKRAPKAGGINPRPSGAFPLDVVVPRAPGGGVPGVGCGLPRGLTPQAPAPTWG